MTQDEVIEIGVKAGIHKEVLMLGRNLELLTEFANLVAAHTLMNIDPSSFMSFQEGVEVGRLAEREACAKLCEEYAIGLERNYSEIIADKIRARGEA